jgi:hypothetical protein
MNNTSKSFGEWQWLVKVSELLSKSREIIVEADEMIVVDGALTFIQNDKKLVNLSISAGQWTAAYRINVLNETPLAVVKWQGEIRHEGFGEETQKIRV